MGNVWREYGVIAVLLVVAVGGYLVVSRGDRDVVTAMMDRLSEQLLGMIPDASARASTQATLLNLRDRVDQRSVQPEQLEQLAANVLNLRASGSELSQDEARLVIELALEEASALSSPGDPVLLQAPPETPPRPSRADLVQVARRLDRVLSIYSDVRQAAPADSSVDDIPPVRFYASDGLRVVIDERLRPMLPPTPESEEAPEKRIIEWQAQLAETVQANRRKRRTEAEALEYLASVTPESVGAHKEMHTLAALRDLESRGLVTPARAESVSVRIERHIGSRLQKELSIAIEQASRDYREAQARIRAQRDSVAVLRALRLADSVRVNAVAAPPPRPRPVNLP